jgi:hypothetical protein
VRPDDAALGPTPIAVGCANFEAVIVTHDAARLGVTVRKAGEQSRPAIVPTVGAEHRIDVTVDGLFRHLRAREAAGALLAASGEHEAATNRACAYGATRSSDTLLE